MGTYERFPVTFIRGKGCWLWDQKGKRYLDAVAGIATCSLGHSDNALRHSLTKQLNQIQHVSNLYIIPEQEALARFQQGDTVWWTSAEDDDIDHDTRGEVLEVTAARLCRPLKVRFPTWTGDVGACSVTKGRTVITLGWPLYTYPSPRD